MSKPTRIIIASLLVACTCLVGCSGFSTVPSPWQTLTTRNNRWSGQTGCWEGWNIGASPGKFYEYRAAGLALAWAHPEYYAAIEPDGSLSKPGYQDSRHQGQASMDYPELMDKVREIKSHDFQVCFALFVHNFEAVSQEALTAFFRRWSLDLAAEGLASVIFIPAWEVQGQWPAWSEGATRDCFVQPSSFNAQMSLFKQARDAARLEAPAGAEIKLGIVVNGWVEATTYNSFGFDAFDYLAGLEQADWVGVDYYPKKVGSYSGPASAFEDAAALYSALTPGKDFAITEYGLDFSGDRAWTDEEKIAFINETYDCLERNPFIKQIHWWFIGRSGDSFNARVSF